MPNSNIKIQTERLAIVSFEIKHLDTAYVSWLNDTTLMQYSEQRHKTHSIETCQAYLDSFKNSENYFFAIENKQGQILGTMTVYQDTNNHLADIGIMIGAIDAQGMGIGFEAWSAVLKWTETELKPRKITGGCMASNTAMINIMKKSDMLADGIRIKHFELNNKFEDIVYMAKFFNS